MTIRIGDARLTLDDLARIARDDGRVELARAARERVAEARAVVDRLAVSSDAIYGLNTALGANTGAAIAGSDLADYQRRAVLARAVGVGPAWDRASVRAMLAARVAGMAAGGSGVSPHVLDALVELLNRGVTPVVPRTGTISVADLPQLAHLALTLIGEGDADVEGVVLPAREALARVGLAPIDLGAKDGMALISANAATIGRAALVAIEARQLTRAWLVAVALSFEGFRANLSPLDERATQARPAPGQVDVGALLRALLAGSALWHSGAARRVQDPLSLRVVAQVHGAAQWIIDEACAQIELELNCAADSPLVVASDGLMLSNGNFHVPALAMTLDACAIAIAQVSSLAVERCIKFMSPAFTGLPLQLTRHGPSHSGFATVQKTLTSLWAQIRHNANPGSLDFLPVSERVEDHATMAMLVADKLGASIDRARYLVAIELLIAAQAVDLREMDIAMLGGGARIAYAQLRAAVPFLDTDRPLGPDIDRVAALVRENAFGPAPEAHA